MFEVANAVVGRIHHFAYLQVPGAVITLGYQGVQGFATKVSGRHACPLLVRENGVELDGMEAGEVETAFFHPPQNSVADIIVQDCAHEVISSAMEGLTAFPLQPP
ncbi:hypothetical protein D9M68_813850 [compost metagenome]